MRRLFALGLTVCVVGSAAAQTEVIIRRPGQKDQVIRLDSAHTKEALVRAQAEIEKATTALHQRMKEMAGNLSQMHGTALTEAPLRLNTLALKNNELAAENFLAPLMKSFAAAMRQPHFGIGIDTRPRESDKYGAYITSVTPGSPAEKAGIMSGDIITKIAGKSLTDKDAKDDSGPGVRLISIISTLTVGKPVEVELRRGTQNKTVKVTPDESEGGVMARMAPSIAEASRLPVDRLNWTFAPRGETPARAGAVAVPGFNIFSNGNGAFAYSFGDNGLFASYELAPLNEKLGAYFGTTEGVLVVNNRSNRVFEEASVTTGMARDVVMGRIQADSLRAQTRIDTIHPVGRQPDSFRTRVTVRGGRTDQNPTYINGVPVTPRRPTPVNIGLEPGDVIVSVGGRKVTTPSQLMRIVGSYDHNDEFKLEIMRQKHAETLTVKMP